MTFPPRTRTALRALARLAGLPGGARALVADLARAQSASPTYLAKVFQTLARRGILRSARGRHGGYRLARPAAEIRLGDVLRALRGPDLRAADPADAPLLALLREAEAEMHRALDRRTLADLAAAPPARRPATTRHPSTARPAEARA